jgi:hypothetical protein
LFISHSSKDDLAAEAMRIHLVKRGWNREEIFLDFSVDGISWHEKWKTSLAEAKSKGALPKLSGIWTGRGLVRFSWQSGGT